MKLNLPQIYFSKLMRAVVEFELIDDDDHILIGISGGKDSIFLAYAMAVFQKRFKKSFKLSAVTVNPNFSADFDTTGITKFCNDLGIHHETVDVDIAGTIAGQQDKNPCFTCAFFRRGAINRYAKEHNMNKIAYAHHNDDAVETFLMGLFYSGQLSTFTPKTYLDRTDLTVIRPLIYFRENELKDMKQYHNFTPIPSPCPYDGNTARQKVKDLIATLSEDNPQLYPHLAAAMRESSLGELWPREQSRQDMKNIYHKYMYS